MLKVFFFVYTAVFNFSLFCCERARDSERVPIVINYESVLTTSLQSGMRCKERKQCSVAASVPCSYHPFYKGIGNVWYLENCKKNNRHGNNHHSMIERTKQSNCL